MKPRHWMFLSLLAGMGLYELWALQTPDTGDTISEMAWDTTRRYPLLPFSVGVLIGHFFWQSASFKHPE